MADFGEVASVVTDGDFPSRPPEEPRLLNGAIPREPFLAGIAARLNSAPALANAGPVNWPRAAPAHMEDLMEKADLLVVTYAQANRLARVVVGRNQDWKQNMNLGAKQNPNLHVHPAYNVARRAAHEVRPRRD